MKYQTVLFDFDGVLCRDRFYEKTLLPENESIYRWIQENIFGNHDLVQKWMRGKISWKEINKIISDNTGFDQEQLNQLFISSVQKMEIDYKIEQLVKSLKKSGMKLGIVTDNMDIFSEITITNHKLNEIFDIILNSADQGLLKKDGDGKLFAIALEKLGSNIENSLLIDDSKKTIDFFENKGGNGFHYQEFEGLKSHLNDFI